MDKNIIGQRVRRQRESLELTREQFAEQVSISPQFLAEIENGTKGMSAETLCKICEHGATSADYILFGRVGNGEQSPIAKMLKDISPKYSVLIEDVVRSFKQAIDLSNEPDGGEK